MLGTKKDSCYDLIMDERKLAALLDSSDHLEVCSSLKALAKLSSPSSESLTKVIALARPGIVAVERNALATLFAWGPRAAVAGPTLLASLATQLSNAQCTYDCCGLHAFSFPIEGYIQALLSVEGITTMAQLEKGIFPKLDPQPNAELLKRIFADIDDLAAWLDP